LINEKEVFYIIEDEFLSTSYFFTSIVLFNPSDLPSECTLSFVP